MDADELLDCFHERRPSSDLPFVLGDEVEVLDGVHAGRRGEVVVLAHAHRPIELLVEFGDGTDGHFPASMLRLVHRERSG